MTTSVFVRTSGTGSELASGWHPVDTVAPSPLDTEFLDLWECRMLVDRARGLSLAIERGEKDLRLLITGLHVGTNDIDGATIWASIAVETSEDPEDEATLRGLAAAILTDPMGFQQRINEFIVPSAAASGEFEVEPALSEWMISGALAVQREIPDPRLLIGQVTEGLRARLVAELVDCRLPGWGGPLVVVCTKTDGEPVPTAGAWRVLAPPSGDAIADAVADWQDNELVESSAASNLSPPINEQTAPVELAADEPELSPTEPETPPGAQERLDTDEATSNETVPLFSNEPLLTTAEDEATAEMAGEEGDALRVFARTAGYKATQEFRWVDTSIVPPRPIDASTFRSPKASLLHDVAMSLFLDRHSTQLFLQISGLMTNPERKESSGKRPLTIDLALLGDPSTEPMLRGLIVSLLRDQASFERFVSNLLPFNPDAPIGFDVAERFGERLAEIAARVDAVPPDPTPLVALNTEQMRLRLADDLATFALPPGDGTRVVVTMDRSERVLAEAGTWRGLTSQPKRDNADDRSTATGPSADDSDELGEEWSVNWPTTPHRRLRSWITKSLRVLRRLTV